jgi:hypothetical protein
MISEIKILISRCTAQVYLRWYFNGWHYFNFTNGYDISMQSENMDVMTTRLFSRISKTERPTRLKAEYSYKITLEGIAPENIEGFNGLLLAEKVEQYEGGIWYEVDITRGSHVIKDENAPGYILDFEITRNELPNTPAVYQKSLKLYLEDDLCDMDDDEIVPVNKQVNDIAEMQDRQSDFTATFKVRKTRAMRALFELSGEVGASTTFPFEEKSCKLIQDNIEMITGGLLILDKVDDLYYYVSILSGNSNFFKSIESLKITDLTLGSTNHTWNAATQAASHAAPLNYIYPLCEASDDAKMAELTDTGNAVSMYGGWIWPFIKVKAIWDEIFSNAGYICTGDILTNPVFLKLFIPIANLKTTNTKDYLYSLWWGGSRTFNVNQMLPGGTVINGDALFATGHYTVRFTAKYRIIVNVIVWPDIPTIALYCNGINVGTFTLVAYYAGLYVFEINYDATVLDDLTIWTINNWPTRVYTYYSISIIEITDAKIGYSSPVTPAVNLPDISQTDFIKIICNMFGLIAEVNPRDRKIFFWNYLLLYDNIPIARDWSNYLSERDDETEFKFGEYAQNNYMRYEDSDDVIKDNGRGIMQIDDETLPKNKDVIELPISTCDEVIILTDINVSRIAFNEYDPATDIYDQVNSIDPRIVFVSQIPNTKTLTFRTAVELPYVNNDVVAPYKASSIEVSFSNLVTNYVGLSRLLTKTNLRRARFNLPVYEVAGLKHYIPIYLNQYKAYFYVNKINNYVAGKLCTIDLIKL